jgi:hypothetical protein
MGLPVPDLSAYCLCGHEACYGQGTCPESGCPHSLPPRSREGD